MKHTRHVDSRTPCRQEKTDVRRCCIPMGESLEECVKDGVVHFSEGDRTGWNGYATLWKTKRKKIRGVSVCVEKSAKGEGDHKGDWPRG